MKFDKELERKYIAVRSKFWDIEADLGYQSVGDLENIIIDLKSQIKVLNLRIQELERKL